ncbi:hypothetical protein BJ170DRAFT_618491 [Xylariales sp. AK1849]|nr:hypothetical protein BJ170DRAFT_618491 [Xylariales sp. AK1849]
MKVTIVVTFLAFAVSVSAASCNQGGSYCGMSLLHKGNYRKHIEAVLERANETINDQHITNSRFDCLTHGRIVFREFCENGCGGTESSDPDFCYL